MLLGGPVGAAYGGIINWGATFQFYAAAGDGSGSVVREQSVLGQADWPPTQFDDHAEFSGDFGGGSAAFTAIASTASWGYLEMSATLSASEFGDHGYGFAWARADVYFEIENVHPNTYEWTFTQEVNGLAPIPFPEHDIRGPGLHHFVWEYEVYSTGETTTPGSVAISFEIPSPGAAWVVGPMLLLWRRRR